MTRPATLFATVRSEGALLPPDLLARVANRDKDLAMPRAEDYGLAAGDRLNEAAARAWALARNYWAAYQETLKDPRLTTARLTEARREWILPLFRCLDYGELVFNRTGEQIGDRAYAISHHAGDGPDAIPIHTVSPLQKLESSGDESGRRISPHALMQEYLNRTDHLWGMVTNGQRLRLLRDNLSLSRAAYLEFDLEAMFEGGAYADFLLLYLLLHRSRLPQPGKPATACPLELWREAAQKQGARALDHLRGGVETAIKALGQGFLAHPANEELRARLRAGELDVQGYYRQLLRLVYRMLFLLVAEERDLLFPPLAGLEQPAAAGLVPTIRSQPEVESKSEAAKSRRVYALYYSLDRLRDVSARRRDPTDRHDDLWRGLQVTFSLLRGESSTLDITALDLPALGVGLFDRDSCPDLDDALVGNPALIEAIRGLSQVTVGKIARRINYRDMDVEELGSVYESLLDYHPIVRWVSERPRFEFVQGSERKTTGSYYTPSELVLELIKSALDPVIAQALEGGRTREQKRAALLRLTVCDPAAGSGHFLLAAARRIGRALAQLDSGDGEPDPAAIRAGTREAIRHCIYGVDLNPLAVDLCKLALWIEGQTPGKPLSFLDHRIKCGNSLVGATPTILEAGIPDAAFTAVTGDEKSLATLMSKRNREERKSEGNRGADQLILGASFLGLTASEDEVLEAMEIADLPDNSTEDTGAKRSRYERLAAGLAEKRLVANTWAAAFFWTLRKNDPLPPTQMDLRNLRHHRNLLSAAQLDRITEIAADNRFFHWHLEFPDVYGEDGDGGFDCVLGNPPWEQIQLDAREYFRNRLPEISDAQHMADRDQAIVALEGSHPQIYWEFKAVEHNFEKTQLFYHDSGRFPLTSYGRLNSAPLFAELSRTITAPQGRAGLIVPTGIATDSFNQYFFADLSQTRNLISLFDFENSHPLFESVHRSYKFCLLVTTRAAMAAADFAFFLTNTGELTRPEVRFTLDAEDITLLNPNTRTCPVFRTAADAALTKAIYQGVPVLVNEATGENPWGFKGLLMFMMNTGSVLFRTGCQLLEDGWKVDGSIFHKDVDTYLPLYEAKLLHQYDHRWATYAGTGARDLTAAEKADPHRAVTPRYWVPRAEVEARLADRWDRGWLLGWRDICRSTDERTLISSVFPRVGSGDTFLLAMPASAEPHQIAALLGNFNSIVLDYATRQKIGGTHLKYHVFKQLPILPPDRYTTADLDFVVPRVLELVYTAWDLQPFARDLGYEGPPFVWDEGRRAILRAELDAYYARLYGLSRKQLRYILDPHDLTDRELADILDPTEDSPDTPRTSTFPGETFRVLKNREIKEYGEFRTGRLVLAAWDKLHQPVLLPLAPPAPATPTAVDISPMDRHIALFCRMIALHRDYERGEWLGRTKVEKLSHLAENVFELNLDRHPVRDVAGPVDFQHLLQVIDRARAEGIFAEHMHTHSGRKRYSYSPLPGFDEALRRSEQVFGEKVNEIDRLIKSFVGFTTDDTEVRATLFAVWNDLLAKGSRPSDNEIFTNFYNWAPGKHRFSEVDLRVAIADLRQLRLVPTGNGRLTEPIDAISSGPDYGES